MLFANKKLNQIYTYSDYVSWPDEERWELINGIAYDMSPAPSRQHQDISREIEMQIAPFLKNKKYRIYDSPFDVRLPDSDEDEGDIQTIVQPDLVIVCNEKKLDEKGCLGAPDIVIEILSPATALKDKREKFYLYEKHKVKEYWLIEPADNTVMIFTLGENQEYGKPRIFSKDDKITTPLLKGLEIDLKPVFA